MTDKSTEIRVAVALVALKFKPIRQSCVSYVFDLRDRFTGPCGDARSTENALVGGEWRERALELEARCSKLEQMFEWEKLERLVGTSTAVHATADGGKKREKKKDKDENRTRADLERVLNGKMACNSLGGLITISARSALAICERLMRARDGLMTSPSDSVAKREEIWLTAIPVVFAVARSGFEELGNMIEAMADVGRSSREICDVLGALDWMLHGMLNSLFSVTQRFVKATGWRAKQLKRLEGLVEEECNRTFGILAEAVMVRLIHFIFPWMERMLERSEETREVPMELIGVLGGAWDAVEQFGDAASVRERVAVEVCQELKGLPGRIAVDGGSKSVQERKQRLAKKEAVWYLGVVLESAVGARLSAGMAGRLVDGARVGGLGRAESEFVLDGGYSRGRPEGSDLTRVSGRIR